MGYTFKTSLMVISIVYFVSTFDQAINPTEVLILKSDDIKLQC